MKKFLMITLAGAAMAMTAPVASAQSWRSINDRQERLDDRIDVGVRNGALTRAEAGRLRAEYGQIASLERRYRDDGLSRWERTDLDRRFDSLSSRVRDQRNDRQDRGDRLSINERQENIDQRIDRGVRRDQLSWIEATKLRDEYSDIGRLETNYRRDGDGLSNAERRYLNYRLAQLSREIRDDRHDEDLWWW